jgi:hypothetical protein
MIRRLVFACAALLGCAMVIAATAGPAAAQADRPGKSAPKSKQSSPITTPIVFYAAKGQPDACGPGCSEWIAAEGQFDVGAPQRLRTFLARHSASTARTDAPSDGRKLPIFFHSSGGLQDQAIAIGRLLREREMTAGVSRTIPAGCVGASDEACRALKQSGKKLDAELRSVASCNSACVYALVGGKARQVPPGARLGVHSGRLIQVCPDGRVEFVSHSSSPAGDKARFAEMNAKLQRYLREMRMDAGLFELASRIPHEQIHYLSRDEIVRFGIDPREFQESRWMAMEVQPQPFSIFKFVVEAKGAGRKEFRTSAIRVACAASGRVVTGYLRGLGSDETGAARSIKFALDSRSLVFGEKASIAKIDALDTGGSFDTRYAYGPSAFFEAAAARGSIDVIETDPTDPATPSRTIKLSTDGLSKALGELQKTCQ